MNSTKEPDNQISNKWVFTFVFCVAVVCLRLMAWGYVGKGITFGLFAFAIGLAVKNTWELRQNVWYWVTVGSMIALHLALVLLIPWPNVYIPGARGLFFIIMTVDGFTVYGLIKLVEKVMRGKGKPGSEN